MRRRNMAQTAQAGVEPSQVLSQGNPTVRDNITTWIAGTPLVGNPAGDRSAIDRAKTLTGIAEFIPGVGEATGGDDIGRDLTAGNYGSAGINMAATALGTIPMVGDFAGRGVKKTGGAIMDMIRGDARPIGEIFQDTPVTPEQLAKLPGLPEDSTGPASGVVQAAHAYAKQHGIDLKRQDEYVKADPIRGANIADEYERMADDATEPATQASYNALAKETMAQWEALKASGLKVQFIKPGQADPYPGGPKEVLQDIKNGHLWVFPTDQGFGTLNASAANNPLLQPTGETVDGHPMVVNDVFRAVHDFFGHGLEGVGFGARGEENAWNAHQRLFSKEALPALTAETRGQNSWVNFGPYGKANRANQRETVYADQKTGNMPEWTMDPNGKKPSDGTLGDINNPGDEFEGVSPRDFTPGQWGRYGKKYNVKGIGPESDEAFEASLKPYKSESGKEYTIPGGIDGKEPFTYYDLLHIKQQGINPNDMSEVDHQKLHDRMVRSVSPGGKLSDPQIFNQFAFAMASPNQPLTDNELMMSRIMAKGHEDIDRFAKMIPWNYKDRPKMSRDEIKEWNAKLTAQFGINAGSKGGIGAAGTADYTRIAEFAQMMKERPDFFRFRGAAEGGKNSAEHWSNFVERVSSQVPGLSAKTGSFGAVWQNAPEADISAVDRHMIDVFRKNMFKSKSEAAAFDKGVVSRYNAKNPDAKVKTLEELRSKDRGAWQDAMFSYVNKHPKMKAVLMRTGEENANAPGHMRQGSANWVHQPVDLQLISPAYRRVLAANADDANARGQSTFASQWMLWDRKRQRLEPHEIMHPSLTELPRMKLDDLKATRAAHKEAGYMASTRVKNEFGEKELKPVRPAAQGSNRGSSASKMAYFSIPALIAGGAMMGNPDAAEAGESWSPPKKSDRETIQKMLRGMDKRK